MQAFRNGFLTWLNHVTYFGRMSEQPTEVAVPRWTLADRLRKARLYARLEQSELARDIGIARSSIVNYETGRTSPSRPVLLSWALRCRVPVEWLAHGEPGSRGEKSRFLATAAA